MYLKPIQRVFVYFYLFCTWLCFWPCCWVIVCYFFSAGPFWHFVNSQCSFILLPLTSVTQRRTRSWTNDWIHCLRLSVLVLDRLALLMQVSTFQSFEKNSTSQRMTSNRAHGVLSHVENDVPFSTIFSEVLATESWNNKEGRQPHEFIREADAVIQQ